MPAWDSTKPAASTALVSSEVRQNFDALGYALFGVNLIADPTYLMWPAETINTLAAVGLAHWSISGASAQYVRCGTGLSDTNRKAGLYSAKVTAGGAATANLSQTLLSTTTYDDIFDNETFSFGAWVKCSSASAARVSIYDGNGTTYSSYHTGDGTWQWLTGTRTINAAADRIVYQQEVAQSISAYFSGATVVIGPTPPAAYRPAPVIYGTLYFPIVGTQTTGTNKVRFVPSRPMLVKDVFLRAETAPTGQALIVDVNTWDGSAFTSMYTTRPQIAAAASSGSARPDATAYSRRCMTGSFGSSISTGGMLTVDIDQVGSGTAGADLTIHVRCLQYARPLENFGGYNEIA